MAQTIAGTWGFGSVSVFDISTSKPQRPPTFIFGIDNGLWNTSQSYDPCIPDPTADPLVVLFSGMAAPPAFGTQQIGRATASRAAFLKTPLTAWTQDASNPVMQIGTTGQPDSGYIRQSSCFYNPDDSGKLWMYYTCGQSAAVGFMCLGISSDNGHTWVKQGVVVNPTITGCSDETNVTQGAVLRRGAGDYIMVYSYRTASLTLPGTRHVISTDGRTWTGTGCANSMTIAPLFLEQHQILMVGGKCYLAYEYGNNTTTWNIGLASATTCEGPFTNTPNSPILSPSGVAGTWDQTIIATPWLFAVNGNWYLWYCGTDDSTTDYNVDEYPLSIAQYNSSLFTVQ